MITNQDVTDPNVFYDCQWYKDANAFLMHVDFSNQKRKEVVMGFMKHYCKPIEGVLFGGHDSRIEAKLNGIGAKITFAKSRAGYIRDAPMGRNGPPSIVASMRRVLPGRRDMLIQSYAYLGGHYKMNDKGVVAFLAASDPKDPDLVHDLQVFADDEGFVSHADESNGMVKEGFGRLFKEYDFKGKKQPALAGVAWSNDNVGLKTKTDSMGAQFKVFGYDSGHTGSIDLTAKE